MKRSGLRHQTWQFLLVQRQLLRVTSAIEVKRALLMEQIFWITKSSKSVLKIGMTSLLADVT